MTMLDSIQPLTCPARPDPPTPTPARVCDFWCQYLALLGGNRRISVDEFSKHSAEGFNAQGKWGHIQEQHVCDVTRQHTALDGSSDGDGLVRVDGFAGSTAKQVLYSLLDLQRDCVNCSKPTIQKSFQTLDAASRPDD